MEHEELTERIIGCAMTVHKTLGPGFLESVYQRSLTHELRKCGLLVVCEQRLVVKYDAYTIAPYSYGQPEIVLPWATARTFVRPEFLPD